MIIITLDTIIRWARLLVDSSFQEKLDLKNTFEEKCIIQLNLQHDTKFRKPKELLKLCLLFWKSIYRTYRLLFRIKFPFPVLSIGEQCFRIRSSLSTRGGIGGIESLDYAGRGLFAPLLGRCGSSRLVMYAPWPSRCIHACNARDPLATMAMRGRLSVINSLHCQYLEWKRCDATVRNNEAIINESRLRARGTAFSNGGKLNLRQSCIVNVTRSVQFAFCPRGIHKDLHPCFLPLCLSFTGVMK